MHDLEKELHRTCERATQELSQLNDRLENNKNVMSPTDLEIMFKLMDIVKDTKSTLKKIIEIEEMEDQNEYSGTYYNQPMYDRRYSGNSYRGTYTVESGGDGYSGRRSSRHMYSRDSEQGRMHSELEDMLRDTRDPQEAEVIRKIMNKL